jgi:hypothetical protein
MSLELDDKTFHRLLDVVMPGEQLAPAEAIPIALIAQLAGGIDLKDDDAERGLLDVILGRLCELSTIRRSIIPVLSPRPLPEDGEARRAWVNWLAGQVATPGARELALVLAYLLVVADLELAPVEAQLIEELRGALAIDADRARELIAEVSASVTPGAPAELLAAAH